MKIKCIYYYHNFRALNFTGIFEFCDGARNLLWMEIEYYKNGNRHNENGPAREWPDGSKEWFLEEIKYSEKDWKMKVEKSKKWRWFF
jgi:hypothetical protein